MKITVKHPSKVFPQSIPRLLNSGRAANGIPAPIIDLKKSLDARTEAAYWGYAWGRYVRKGMNLVISFSLILVLKGR
jgi:hypothetical protein